MTTLLALLPLLLVLGLLASGRASALAAGLAGLLATLAASLRHRRPEPGQRRAAARLFLRETAAGFGSPGTSSPSSPPACSSIAACRPAAARADGERARRQSAAAVVGLLPAGAVRRIGDGLRRRLHHRARRPAPARPGRHAGAAARPLQPVAGAVGRARHRHDGGRHPGRPDAQPARPRLGAAAGADPRLLSRALLALRARGRHRRADWRRRSTMRSGPRCCSAWSGWSTATATSRSPAPPRPRCCWPLRFWRDERPDRARLRAALRANAPYVALTAGALRHAAGAAAARFPEAAVGAGAVRQPAGLRAALRAGLLAGLDRPGRGVAGARLARPRAGRDRPRRLALLRRHAAVRGDGRVLCRLGHGAGDRRGAARRGRPRRGARRAAVRRRRRLPDRRRRRPPTPC